MNLVNHTNNCMFRPAISKPVNRLANIFPGLADENHLLISELICHHSQPFHPKVQLLE